MKTQNYRILQNKDIDFNKWDSVVKNSINESPLAYSEVLNIISPQWEGLIVGDYEAVMPLPVQKRLGYKLIQMPGDVQNLGLFSKFKKLINIDHDFFIDKNFKNYKFISYSFVFENKYIANKNIKLRTTHYIDLNKKHEVLFKKYDQRHRRNLKDFNNNNVDIIESTDIDPIINIRKEMSKNVPALILTAKQEHILRKLLNHSLNKNIGKLLYAKYDSNYIASGFFLKGQQRDVFLISASSTLGKEKKAAFGIIDYYLKQSESQNKILDLCGSDIKGIALFLKGFGAKRTNYVQYSRNQLPYALKVIKKHNLLIKIKKMGLL
jgi:hypothetical protein